MDTNDYALVGEKEISELKQDVDYLKKNPLGGTSSGRALQESINKLNESISELISIFKEASEQMKAEERESDIIVQKIQPLYSRLDELSQQNEKIAKGILAVADMITSREQQRPRPQQQPMQQPRPMMPPMPRPGMPMPRPSLPTQPPRLPPLNQMPSGLPPPPMPTQQKKGLFGMMK